MAYIGRDIQYGVLDKQSFTANNSTTAFSLNSGVKNAKSLLVSIGGIIQEPDVAYTASGTTLTFTTAPATGMTVYAIYLGKTLESGGARDQITFQNETGDGTTTPFTLSAAPVNAQSIMVTLNGVTQVPGTDYIVAGTTITFTTAPVNGMGILVYHLGTAAAIGEIDDASVTDAKIVGMNASKLTGTLPANTVPNTSIVTMDAAKLTGILPSSMEIDTTAIDQTIASLGMHVAVADNKASFNLPGVFIDQFESDTGILTETTVDRNAGEYVASIYSSDTVTTPASASDWTGNTGSFTLTSGGADSIAGDDSIKSTWTSGTGDFTVQLTVTSYSNQVFGVFPVSEDSSHASNDSGGMNAMTNSWWWQGNNVGEAAEARFAGSSFTFTDGDIIEDGSVVQIKRVSGTISFLIDGATRWTYSQTSNADLRFCIAHHGTTNGNVQSMTFTVPSTTTNATGTLISTASTADAATTTASGVMVYENSSGTATLGTDLKAYFSADDGANWTEASSYGSTINFNGASKKLVKLGKTTGLTSGTQMKLKAEWANQVAPVAGTQSLIAQNTGTAIGNMTEQSGLAAAFNGNKNQAYAQNAVADNGNGPGYIGKDWGNGNTKKISGVKIWGSNETGYGGTGHATGFFLYGSNSAPTGVTDGTLIATLAASQPDVNSTNPLEYLTGIDTTNAYRYHWFAITTPTNTTGQVILCELEFYETSVAVTGKETRLHGWAINY